MGAPDDLEAVETDLTEAVGKADTLDALDAVRVAALGKKGTLSALLRDVGQLDPEARRTRGAAVNALKTRIAEAIETRRTALDAAALAARLATEHIDITLPPPPDPLSRGRLHPLTHVTEEMVRIFAALGFDVAEGPDIETDFYNFTALNIPEAHPARQMHDTFYMADDAETDERRVLRTHTSPVQIRTMQNGTPPFRFIAPGRTYRCDSDRTHTPMFHQLEGVAVDAHTHLGHLKWVIRTFLGLFFEVGDVEIRLRPSYFPFTEPSLECDVRCRRAADKIIVGEGDDWLEIGGCGMVQPVVLAHANVDPDRFQGFAFGLGIDRLAMLKYGMPDLRAFFDADLRWLAHYGFPPFDTGGAKR